MIRQSQASDIDRIMEIIADAQQLLRSHNTDQWQDGYPTPDIIAADIARKESYVLCEDGQIVATAVISFAGEVTYNHIDGYWLNDEPYCVIHRMAVSKSAYGKGLAKRLFAYAENLCQLQKIKNIRVDTHADNIIMKTLLKRLGYTYCGVITLLSGALRIAFQKRIFT